MHSLISIIVFRVISDVIGANPVMTQASMDVGKIISIVIPEGPDSNINIDKLTSDFKHQLEDINQQRRVNKLEHGLVTLKSILPKILSQEKLKGSPLLDAVLQRKRNTNPSVKNWLKENTKQPKKSSRAARRHVLKKKNSNYHIQNVKQRPSHQIKKKKYEKPSYLNQEMNRVHEIDDWNLKNRRKEYRFPDLSNWDSESDAFDCNKTPLGCPNDYKSERTQSNFLPPRPVAPKYSKSADDFWYNPPERSEQEPKMVTDEPCDYDSNDFKVRNAKDVDANDYSLKESADNCVNVINPDGQLVSYCNNETQQGPDAVKDDDNQKIHKDINIYSELSEPITYPININVEDFKDIDKIIQNPQNVLDRLNSSTFEDPKKTKSNNENWENISNPELQSEKSLSDSSNNYFYQIDPKNPDVFSRDQLALAFDQVTYQNNPKVNYGNENLEIRIRRSTDK